MWRRMGPLLAAVLAVFALTGAGQVGTPVRGPEDRGAARAVAVLTGTGNGEAGEAVPEDFEGEMGYRPDVVYDPAGVAHLVKPDGACSSLVGATTYDFSRACGTHDYGYDLLRYATARGGELGPWARSAIDDRLGEDLHQHCAAIDGGTGCRTLATLGIGMVEINSWRQAQGNPGREDPVPYVASGLLIGAAVALPPIRERCRRRARRLAVRRAVVPVGRWA